MNLGADFDWNQARAFLATAEEGSLSAAARTLRQTQPTLSRQVAALEKSLGVTLFERLGKRLLLTETGHALLSHVRAMAEAASSISLSASGRAVEIAGEVRITAGEAVSAYLLPPILERIAYAYPEIEIQLVVSNEIQNLLQREADIAIRHVRPDQGELVAKKVRDTTAHLYASKSWLEKNGQLQHFDDAVSADFIGADEVDRFVEILGTLGLRISRSNFKWRTNSHVVAWQLSTQGLGISGMTADIAKLFPEVEQVLPQLPAIPVPYWLCTHRELHTSRRIRVMYDMLADALRDLE